MGRKLTHVKREKSRWMSKCTLDARAKMTRTYIPIGEMRGGKNRGKRLRDMRRTFSKGFYNKI